MIKTATKVAPGQQEAVYITQIKAIGIRLYKSQILQMAVKIAKLQNNNLNSPTNS